MNDIIKAMKERRSIRRFKADMPKREDIEQIIEAGLYAASGKSVYVFATSGGSDIGKTAEKLNPYLKGAEVISAQVVKTAGEITR